LNTSLV